MDPTPEYEEARVDAILFIDDFKSGELNRAKWNVATTGSVYNDELQAYVDDISTISFATPGDIEGTRTGALVLEVHHKPDFVTADGQTFDFLSGRIDTRKKFTFRYGHVAARMKLPAGIGFWPAFWALGEGKWPQSGEIDIMENTGDPAWVSAAVHGPQYSGESALVNRYYFNDRYPATSWHEYSVDWLPEEMVFKVDGKVIYRVTRPMVDFLGPWVFDQEKYLILNFALGGTYPFKTHGIAEPYYGLPQETVQKIQAGQARVYVDWVCVQSLS
jgi:beta-glucanase (GH16 family)